ncbi:Transmembrane protein 126A [Apodemus speciosus]|uniref:Transmembrane protein 126A n=1 Tax=Apodemus speciosus TaxID=105296 RepID=A0ABQ0EZM2_APOSI
MESHKPSTSKDDLIFNIISRKIKQLPEPDRNLLEYGSAYIGLNAAFGGLIANSLFRRILNVTQARIASSLPMAVIPFLTANLSYHSFSDLNCETCTTTRGALVGFVLGGLYPILLAIPMNGGLAARSMNQAPYHRGETSSITGLQFLSLSLEKCYFLLYFRLCLQHILDLDNTNSS